MLKTTIERLGDTSLRLDVEVPEEDLRGAVEETLAQMGRELRVPGFRPGKVPRQAVMARLGRQQVVAETVRMHLDDWYRSAVLASGIRPVAAPDVDLPDEVGTGPLRFSATVEVVARPEIPELATIEVDRPNLPAVQRYVDQVLEATLRGAGTLEPTGAPAEDGDEVVVDFACRVDGETVTGASATGYQARLGEGRLLGELETAIVGTDADAKLDVPVTFPADHPMTDLAGRDAEFAVHVREVGRVKTPALTDELAARVSEFTTAAELEADIRGSITKRLEGEVAGIFRGNAVAALAAAVEMSEPAALVQSRQQELYHGLTDQLAQNGLSIEQYLDRSGRDPDALLAELEQSARDDLRRELVLLALAEKAGISVGEQDLRDEVAQHAAHTGREVDETMQQLMSTGRADQLRGELLVQRTIDHLVASVTPRAVDLPVQEDEQPEEAEQVAGEGTGDAGQEGA